MACLHMVFVISFHNMSCLNALSSLLSGYPASSYDVCLMFLDLSNLNVTQR